MKTPASSNGLILSSQHGISLRAHWLRGAGVGVVLQALGLVLAFGSSVFLARMLGPSGFGQFSYVLAIVAVLVVMATLGLPTIITRLLAAYQVDEKWELARGLLRWANLMVGLMGLMFGLGLIGTGYVEVEGHPWLYILAAPLVLVLAWTNVRQKTLQGLHHPIAAQLPEQFIKHSIFLAVGVALWFIGYQIILQPEGAMAIWLFSGISSLIAGVIILHRLSPPELRRGDHGYKPAVWRAIALPIFFAEVFGVLFGNSDTILLGLLRSVEDVGLYQVALRLSGILVVLLVASNWVLAPWFSRFHATGETGRMQSIVTRTTRLIFGVTVLIYLVMVIWGEFFLILFFGPAFIGAYKVMLILGAGQLVNVATGPVVNLLAMTGGQRELAWSVAIVAFVNIFLCGLMIPVFGMVGAAIGVAVSNSGYNLLLAWVVKRRSGIRTTIIG